jgi:hypothetical protein
VTEVNDDVPTLVFSGTYAEALFLKTIMESAGIERSGRRLPQAWSPLDRVMSP